ncbi:hypothetical protein H072_5293 [Dactylellina haptotyla CBS 200.50]|uniref:NADP-dependent oxidoreductase domain-containing protein n=1 Tax=Dactylellina haptotyla (strain CBS 200.50) TaxID=1284197 RepID=S8AIB7_DACHA|nr:hypothetical protein H072_5293 [Dactylellina haptotyla CBS 200.50]
MPLPPLPDYLAASVEATKAKYKQVGTSGLRVSVPILGAMSIGSSEWQDWVIEEDAALPLLKAAYDKGINTWDTANVYSNGHSEIIIGKALKKYEIPRHKVVILTKCWGYVLEKPNGLGVLYREALDNSKDYVGQGGLSRGAIFSQVEASLKRLDVEYIDLLQIHRFDPTVPIEETMKALHDLVQSGKVRYIGASSMWATQFARMQFAAEKNGWTKFVSMQNQYNLLYREEEREMNRFCNDTGVGLIPWAPLARGHLARQPENFGQTIRSVQEMQLSDLPHHKIGHEEADKEIVKRVMEIAEKKGWKMSHVALAWIFKRVSSPIIGFSSEARMDEALEAIGKELTDEEEKYLMEMYMDRAVTGHS